ncbi:2-(acetamidomethylene)succinate hydrolase [Thermoflexales bacterium]|nr:2-(acetamidomethylene)succinate hydrolase [Thermoflexales bacterium]
MKALNHTSDFVNVNGIRLHYLDWGGAGPALIFLTGMGSSAYIFNKFAPRFTDKFRVLALTRRGHGDSDYPETGYAADTLVEDIRQFMDCLKIETASLAGHSLAGVELTHLAATYPERVQKLIYLEALDDRRWEATIQAQNPLNMVEIKRADSAPPRTFEEYIAIVKRDIPEFAAIWSDLWDEEFSHAVRVNEDGVYVDRMPAFVEKAIVENLIKGYAPQRVEAKIPTLCIYGQRQRQLTDEYTAAQKAAYEDFIREVRDPAFKAFITEFQSRFPHARMIVIPGGHHYCFIAQEQQVYDEMRKFLLE